MYLNRSYRINWQKEDKKMFQSCTITFLKAYAFLQKSNKLGKKKEFHVMTIQFALLSVLPEVVVSKGHTFIYFFGDLKGQTISSLI